MAAELGERPVGLADQGRIVHKGKDHIGHDVGFELPAPGASGAVDEPFLSDLNKILIEKIGLANQMIMPVTRFYSALLAIRIMTDLGIILDVHICNVPR